MQLTGAEIIIECLKEQKVDTVFGYPGGAILNVYDALYKHSDEIQHILTSHEQGASHAADGYARATGKVGVCLATSGPGYRYCYSLYGFRSGCGNHGECWQTTSWKRFFPGSRYCRNRYADYKTQLYCKRHHNAGRHTPQGILHCQERTSGSGTG